ncbi:MAG TPA: hypothetical protein DHN29_08215 [Cytophagales bacterium]|nr:hypothetical protein [Cytophagales bacterium]|tara:strand:- start:1508 stop:1726 length:219 start_codon:yes stop_codon:yes gene_type:complete
MKKALFYIFLITIFGLSVWRLSKPEFIKEEVRVSWEEETGGWRKKEVEELEIAADGNEPDLVDFPLVPFWDD